ncbi:MAG: c-type cytochrome biogenesis protein CcsB [Actinomycetota bacterium]
MTETQLHLASLSKTAFTVALFAYVLAMVGYFHYLAFRREPVYVCARVIAIAGALAHVTSIVTRGFAAGRVPWGNMYEYSSLLALLVVLVSLVYIEGVQHVKTVTGFSLAFSVLTMAVALTAFYVGPVELVPALNSYWIKIHVVAAITGSSLFGLGGILTILYLIQSGRERKREREQEAARRELAAREPAPIMGGSLDDPPDLEGSADETVRVATRRSVLPPSETLDRLAYKTIAFGFPIWTFAVIAGAIWAESAWGRYWGWDPKETWSFITWVVFAGYLHARATAGWRGRKAAFVALVGFASLLVTYYVVNLWIVGLHSYKGF